MSDQIVIDEMNVLLTIPVNAIWLVCKAKFYDENGEETAEAHYSTADLHFAFYDFMGSDDGYFADHQDLLSHDAKEYPVILRVPEMAYEMEIEILALKTDEPEKRTLNRSDLRKARADFLQYIIDGDDYDAVYVLTDEYKAELEKIRSLEGT